MKECIHHWEIAPPESKISTGYCKKCGATREFENFFPEDLIEAIPRRSRGKITKGFEGPINTRMYDW